MEFVEFVENIVFCRIYMYFKNRSVGDINRAKLFTTLKIIWRLIMRVLSNKKLYLMITQRENSSTNSQNFADFVEFVENTEFVENDVFFRGKYFSVGYTYFF